MLKAEYLTKEAFATRLCKVIKYRDISTGQISKATGITAQSIRNYMDGKMMPTADSLIKICSYLKVGADWLLFGVGAINSRWMQ